MKHLLNEMSEQEKNSIRGQHTGGKKIDTSKFRKLLESKLGDAKPLVSEQITGPENDPHRTVLDDFIKQQNIDGSIKLNTNPKYNKEYMFVDSKNEPQIYFDFSDFQNWTKYSSELKMCNEKMDKLSGLHKSLKSLDKAKEELETLYPNTEYCTSVIRIQQIIDTY